MILVYLFILALVTQSFCVKTGHQLARNQHRQSVSQRATGNHLGNVRGRQGYAYRNNLEGVNKGNSRGKFGQTRVAKRKALKRQNG
ncbi:unnamed protein product [Brachionus calyciflorus]|uniref:Secreted protein n=1 Tax=Brachionus calyciflorus TaxID=104777 RepID=A0A813RX98_9BILA|nr:unnamed protein product [Brachionus calyciflorus]